MMRGVPLVVVIRPKLVESMLLLLVVPATWKTKFGWFSALMNVVLISMRTLSVIGMRFTKLASQSKYAGPRSELIGKLPKEPTAGVANKPGLGTELTDPVAETVMFSRLGLMKKSPWGVR